MNELETVLTDTNFEAEVLKRQGTILVDFWASWCYPCQILAPIIDELAQKYQQKVTFGKMDVDANPATSEHYDIKGIPTVIVFRNGQILQQFVGVQPKEVYGQALAEALGLLE